MRTTLALATAVIALAGCGTSTKTGTTEDAQQIGGATATHSAAFKSGKSDCEASKALGWGLQRATRYVRRTSQPSARIDRVSGCIAAYK